MNTKWAIMFLCMLWLLLIVTWFVLEEVEVVESWQGCEEVTITEDNVVQSHGWLCPDGIVYWRPLNE